MLQIVEKNISNDATQKLSDSQQEIDKISGRNAQKLHAEKLWTNKTNNKTFAEIRTVLGEMCKGNERCCYCEDNRASDIEHFFPKSIYPEKTFVWKNYLLICGDCNSAKNNRFPVFTIDSDYVFAELNQSANYNAVLLNPRNDNPLDYFDLDLATFQFVNRFDDTTKKEAVRAEQSLKILKLNTDSGKKGENLTKQRKTAFENFRSHLYRYRDLKEQSDIAEMENVKLYITRTSHPTVWNEMKRYFKEHTEILKANYKDIYDIFAQSPELLEIE